MLHALVLVAQATQEASKTEQKINAHPKNGAVLW
jgi:hypothetical protein